MPRLVLDVMGGDFAPQAMLDGVLRALPEIEGELVLVGDENVLNPLFAKRKYRALALALKQGESRPGCRVSLIHASENIEMDDSIRAIRSKPKATINIGCKMAKLGQDTAFISAGHSGAVMASALLNLGRLTDIERPAIAVILPSLSEDGCVVLDVGANIDCRPTHLRDFAFMGAMFAQVDRKNPELPRVGVLSNGEERSKGNELTRATLELLDHEESLNGKEGSVGRFVGYTEGKEIFKGSVDVAVTDGFVGNVMLKAVEGVGSAVVTTLKREAKTNPITAAGFLLASTAFRRLKRKLDYAEYGAAPLLGVAGYVFICHGRSNAKAVKNALLRTQSALRSRYVERLETALCARQKKEKTL